MLLQIEPLQSLEMVWVIDLTIAARNSQVFTSECRPHLRQQQFFELFIDCFVDVDVIDSHAGLTAVEKLPKNDTLGCTLEVCGFIDDDRTLSTEFQNAGGEIFSSLNRHQSASLSGTGEADDIELETGESLGHLHLSLNHSVKSYIHPALRGSMYFSNSLASTLEQLGESSLGFKTTAFPAEIAAATCGKAV